MPQHTEREDESTNKRLDTTLKDITNHLDYGYDIQKKDWKRDAT